jgi:hypothetical protein
MTFKESIRHNFVSRIVNNQIETKMVNYHSNPKEVEEYRRGSYQVAEERLGNKSKYRLQRHSKVVDLPERELSPSDLSFSTPAFSKQTVYNSYMERKFREKKEYKDFIKRLKKILDPRSHYSIKSTLDRQVEE